MPESTAALVLPSELDQVRLFQFYALFGGDTARVAVVTKLDERTIKSLAHDFSWKQKLGNRKSLDTPEGIADERLVNRASNYVLACTLQTVFDNLAKELASDPKFAREFCTNVDDVDGNTSFATKNLVELAKGIEIISNVKYRALGDKLAAEADVTGEGAGKGSGSLALTVFAALKDRFDQIPSVDMTHEVIKVVAPSDSNGLPAVPREAVAG